MGLLRMAARTAVVAGTATAVSGRVAHRQNEKWDAQEQAQYDQQQAAAAPQRPRRPRTTRTRSSRTWRSSTPRACSRTRSSRPPRPRLWGSRRSARSSPTRGWRGSTTRSSSTPATTRSQPSSTSSGRGDVHDVLDVACGTGLLAAELVGRGYRVVGVDASEEMLARARRLVGPGVELIRDSLPDLGVDGRFDAVVCTLDGITYLEPAQLPPAFTSLSDRLRPDGWLVFDVHTDAMMALTVSRPVVTDEKDGYRFTITSAVDPDARASDTRIEITPPEGTPFGEQHRQYFHRRRGHPSRAGRRRVRGDRGQGRVLRAAGRRIDAERDLDRPAAMMRVQSR